MTETYTGDPEPGDIDEAADVPSARLDREADAILQRDEMRSLGVRPIRQALREDAGLVRDWGRVRANRFRGAVEEEPIRASIYALGIGVLIGLLMSR
ncbi:hypothetical protein [Brevundimonas lenta]|uniref:ElaB/YqjD/DUF883 family membrane-anchored ribosome-binding protein n=1 Tax=Brevundimonas lenta TaxID=424796 RepID=A0A7W6JCM1_9CAUL|nr:hypothetical protein [Brevundimonas lenta]MBB4082674.1 ElaB/YqjD/DUF883 family membrane-anchored ribosome-binding protein [Brevundimonas lenta]